MITCNKELSHRFLSNALSDSESQEFELHIETCAECRDQLGRVAGGGQLESWVREYLSSSTELPLWSEAVLDRSFAKRGSTAQASASEIVSAAELAILSPTDDPNSMGRLGSYEIRAVIGRGGMGTVYKAIDPTLGRTVAIKVLKPELANIGSARQRFSLEARAMAAIAHPNVVPIYAVDEHRGLPYMAMEYVSGGTLEARVRKSGQFEILSIVRIGLQIAQALNAAHDCGLVHRDIKPGNILIDRGIDRIRVADFGLVRVSDDASMTHSGLIAGTPQYMAPEQVRGEACDGRADLFSLGSLLYTLSVGHPPFRADSPYAAMQRIVHDTERPLLELRPELPDWLAAMIHRLLSKAPSDRFVNASQVVDILEQELAYSQNPTRLETPLRAWIPKGRKWSLRKTLSYMTVSILVISLLIAGLFATQLQTTKSATESRFKNEGEVIRDASPDVNLKLWNDDGFTKAVISAERLLQTLQDRSPLEDPLQRDLDQLRERLQALERTELYKN